ncbi:monovalent cation/H(+) antiporter subunit G [Devosia sp. CAU 1758]
MFDAFFEWLPAIVLLIGAWLIFSASLGLLRLPDFYSRLHVTTKAGTVGVGFVLLSAMISSGDGGVIWKSLLIVLLVAITSPLAAHLLSKAAYLTGVPLGDDAITDQSEVLVIDEAAAPPADKGSPSRRNAESY